MAKVLWTKQVPIEQLTPYPGNPRNGDTDAIAASLRAHDQYRAIVVWAGDGSGPVSAPFQVLAGNHTYLAAGEIGKGKMLCHGIECSADEAKRIVLVDNRTNDLAKYDNQQLADLLQSLEGEMGEPGYFDGTGYNVEALDELLERINSDESKPLNPPEPEYQCPECGHKAKRSEFVPED